MCVYDIQSRVVVEAGTSETKTETKTWVAKTKTETEAIKIRSRAQPRDRGRSSRPPSLLSIIGCGGSGLQTESYTENRAREHSDSAH